MQTIKHFLRLCTLLLCAAGNLAAQSYDTLSLRDLSAFRNPPSNWRIASGIKANPNIKDNLEAEQGQGVLVNLPGASGAGDIYTQMEHGDLDLELDFVMAKGSNSGIYLQGRYEIQLLDSWGKTKVGFSDCGGIYQRWVESEQRGYEGYAPRSNASKAPGLWQHLSISFAAPRFDSFGRKIANARILRIALNDVTIHENIELTGPTRGGGDTESIMGPIRIQGDHGPVAFRNIRYRKFTQPPLTFAELSYEHYYTEKSDFPDFSKMQPRAKGKAQHLTHEVIGENTAFTLKFTGKINITVPGRYDFDVFVMGNRWLRIDGNEVVAKGWWSGSGYTELAAGMHTIELYYAKQDPWYPNGLGLYVSGPGLRRHPMHIESSIPLGDMASQIFADFELEPVLLRSFVDFREHPDSASHRITHAISVGFPERVSYTYNLSNGALAQVWRGGFLNTTPMWNDRGDGSSVPNGSPLLLNDHVQLAVLSSPSATWPNTAPAEAAFRPRGYTLDDKGIPTFLYDCYGKKVQDKIQPGNAGGLERIISCADAPQGLYVRVAYGKNIEMISDQLLAVDRRFYIQLPEKNNKLIQKHDGIQELLLPINGNTPVQYQLIW